MQPAGVRHPERENNTLTLPVLRTPCHSFCLSGLRRCCVHMQTVGCHNSNTSAPQRLQLLPITQTHPPHKGCSCLPSLKHIRPTKAAAALSSTCGRSTHFARNMSKLTALSYKNSAGAVPSHTRAFSDRHVRFISMSRQGRCDGSGRIKPNATRRKLARHKEFFKTPANCQARQV